MRPDWVLAQALFRACTPKKARPKVSTSQKISYKECWNVGVFYIHIFLIEAQHLCAMLMQR